MTALDTAEFWDRLRMNTQSRIGLGRTGDALRTRHVLELRASHSAARDAVHAGVDIAQLAERIGSVGVGWPTSVKSRAATREEYLRRPDLGHLPASLADLDDHEGKPRDIGIVLADGLSPRALVDHGPGMLSALASELGTSYSLAPPVIALQARVALGDHIACKLGVSTVLVLIGERPGLSVVDSLGIYLTHRPRPGIADAHRNCISNIHPPEGLGYLQAARVTAGLVRGAVELGCSGIAVKDCSQAEPQLKKHGHIETSGRG